MRREELLALLEEVGAIRQGHFELSSGLHSSTYIQCALVLQYPERAEQLARALAAEFHDQTVDCVVAPALGGILLGYEVARALGVRSIFVERDRSGQMVFRRGFGLKPRERVLVMEDVWTTGGSTRETIGVVEEAGGLVIGAGALIDRSGGTLELNVPSQALLEMSVPTFEAENCPQCRAGGMATQPGSHFARAAR
jgi:orotate phosphoribosyltransferase